MLYNLYVSKNTPFNTLTYSSDNILVRGQVVKAGIKSTEYLAVVEGEYCEDIEIKNLKGVGEQLPYKLSSQCMEAIEKISFLTFNSPSSLMMSTLKHFDILLERALSKKDFILPLPDLKGKSKVDNTGVPSIEYYIEIDWSLRIMVIIRSILSLFKQRYNSTYNILIISPDVNIKNREMNNCLKVTPDLQANIDIYDLTATSVKKLCDIIIPTFYNLKNIKLSNNIEVAPAPKINIFFANKYSLLNDLINIDHIIILDEANPTYISESKIYFDTREVGYMVSNIYNIPLTFISTLPSVRFYDFAKESLTNLPQKTLSIKYITRKGRQKDFDNVILELENESSRIAGLDGDTD